MKDLIDKKYLCFRDCDCPICIGKRVVYTYQQEKIDALIAENKKLQEFIKNMEDTENSRIKKLEAENKKMREALDKAIEGFQEAIYRLNFAHSVIVKKSVKEVAMNNYLDSKKCLKELKEGE